MTEIAIGGYFSWEQGAGTGLDWLRTAAGYQSARCAIVAALRAAQPVRVWAPHYICGAVNDALAASDVAVQRYPLSSEWGPPARLALETGDWLLCVDYFGICRPQIEMVLNKFGSQRVLVDASQSLFHKTRAGETAVYSPRKFLGIPDGGLLITELELPAPPEAAESMSTSRCTHLRSRAEGRVEQGYRQFQIAEESLESCEPVAISRLTASLLATIDADQVAARRIANYQFLAEALACEALAVPPLPKGAVPLCCPVLGVDAPALRQALIRQHIFTATYWPDARIPSDDAVATQLRDHTLYLPCDQRCDQSATMRIVRSIHEIKESHEH